MLKAAKRIRVRGSGGAGWFVLDPRENAEECIRHGHYLGKLEQCKLKDVTFHCLNIPGCGNEVIGIAEGTLSPQPVNPNLESNLGFKPEAGGFYDRNTNRPLPNAKELDLQPGGHAHVKVLTED